MKASVLDLRYKMKEVLEALDRKESVVVLYHGKAKGILRPVGKKMDKSCKEHPLFGSLDSKQDVNETISDLRGGRYAF